MDLGLERPIKSTIVLNKISPINHLNRTMSIRRLAGRSQEGPGNYTYDGNHSWDIVTHHICINELGWLSSVDATRERVKLSCRKTRQGLSFMIFMAHSLAQTGRSRMGCQG